jgi:uncharacterized protein YbjT (DUF2867 family)
MMIAITGATGNTGKPATEALLAKNQKVRAIGRDNKKLEPLVAKGAEAFVANPDDAAALAKAFTGADAVFLVLPSDPTQPDLRAFQKKISDAYVAAVRAAHVSYVVLVSSIGAQHISGTGPIAGLRRLEDALREIPGLNALFLRPVYFMENLLMNIQPIRTMGMLPGPGPADVAIPMIAARDIGRYAAERLAARDFSGFSTQELLGHRDVTMKEVAPLLGNAIGKPNLSYMQVPFLVLEPALVQMGISKDAAGLFIEMWKAGNAGKIVPLEARSAKNTTPTTIETFVTEVFAPAYLGKTATA